MWRYSILIQRKSCIQCIYYVPQRGSNPRICNMYWCRYLKTWYPKVDIEIVCGIYHTIGIENVEDE